MPASPDPAEIQSHIDEALQGIELEPEETAAILGFANEEVPHLQTPETSYLVLGSFRSPYIRRVRLVENELNKRIGSYAFVLGDLHDIEIDRLPVFRLRFYVVATYADAIAAIYEQDAGGEVTELGKISETPFFESTSVFPRDYAWMTDRKLETETDVFAAASRIAGNDDLDDGELRRELETLVDTARSNGIDVSLEELEDRVERRDERGPDVASYSWVHLNEFRLFELHGRCFPWSEPGELRSAVDRIP